MTDTNNFRLIKGGRSSAPDRNPPEFIYGSATDTRLMGVVGLYLVWNVTENGRIRRLSQLFYLDFEENTVDSYYESGYPETSAFSNEKLRMTAALGAQMRDINEREARFLVQSRFFGSAAKGSAGMKLPSGYAFLLEPAEDFSTEEYSSLMDKICTRCSAPEYIINYYLMRAASLDYRGMAHLLEGRAFAADTVRPSSMPEPLPASPFANDRPVTFCLNDLVQKAAGNRWLCRSVTEQGDFYVLSDIEITLAPDNSAVRDAKLITTLRISDIEAAMLLRRSEYVDLFTVPRDSELFRQTFKAFTVPFTENEYPCGWLYVEFNSDNSHVGRFPYRLNDDVKTAYFLSDSGQLAVMTYSQEAMENAENRLYACFAGIGLSFGPQFEFHDPVFYEFVSSEFEDFLEFTAFITESADGPEKN